MSQILIVEDEPVIRAALRKLLERHEHTVEEAASVEDAKQLALHDFDLLISDLRLPGQPGTDLIALAKPTPVLMMTSYASLRSAVDAMKMGAADYIAKPFDHDDMIRAVSGIINPEPVQNQNRRKQGAAAMLLGESDAMQSTQKRIDLIAASDTPVLISGESGSGKKLAARTLHERSHRKQKPFVSIHCGSLKEDQLEAALFGSADQPGQIEAANGGSLLLHNISELPLELQGQLVRLCEQGEITRRSDNVTLNVDVRLMASTQRDLSRRIQDGSFREDLYYRLNVVELNLPPLRERGDDIGLLADSILEQLSRQRKGGAKHFNEEAIARLSEHHWPGNVLELENTIERAILLCEGDEIGADMLDLASGSKSQTTVEPGEELSLEDYFARFVIEHQEHMTETELARKLGISRKSLWERRQRLGIPRQK